LSSADIKAAEKLLNDSPITFEDALDATQAPKTHVDHTLCQGEVHLLTGQILPKSPK
jgi:hypothetical protein